MDLVTVSPKFQIVVLKKFRERLELKPGERLEVDLIADVIHLKAVRSKPQPKTVLNGGAGAKQQ